MRRRVSVHDLPPVPTALRFEGWSSATWQTRSERHTAEFPTCRVVCGWARRFIDALSEKTRHEGRAASEAAAVPQRCPPEAPSFGPKAAVSPFQPENAERPGGCSLARGHSHCSALPGAAGVCHPLLTSVPRQKSCEAPCSVRLTSE